MKKRIISAAALLLCLGLLAGCGTAEPEAATVEATQAPTTEPATEPTTQPTEPLTLFQELGLELWEGFETSSAIYSWADGKEFIHTEGHGEDLNGFMRAELQIGNNKEVLRVLVDTDVDIVIHENTHLEHAVAYSDKEKAKIDEYEDSFEKLWIHGNIQDEDTIYKTKDYYFSTIPPVTG